MSDLFHEDVPTSYIKDVFKVMVAADLHIRARHLIEDSSQ